MQRLKKFCADLALWVNQLAIKVGAWSQATVVRVRSDAGQTVAEYALVLLVVAAIAVAFLLWARQSGKLDAFFNAIFEKLVSSVDATPAPSP